MKKRGSVSLEAALVLPLLLLFFMGFLGHLTSIRRQLLMTAALRRAADEWSLLLPALTVLDLDQLDQAEGSLIQDVRTLAALFGPLSGPVQGLVADALITQQLGPALLKRQAFWMAEAGEPLGIQDQRTLFLDWQSQDQLLWVHMSWLENSLWGRRTVRTRVAVPLWGRLLAGPEAAQVAQASVWSLDNFSRGKQIRQAMGGSLPDTFPVIAAFSDGCATAIRSLDFTAASYADPKALARAVRCCLDDLDGFDGASFNRSGTHVEVRAADIHSKRLLLVIPDNQPPPWLAGCLADLAREAGDRGLLLETVRYQTSPG